MNKVVAVYLADQGFPESYIEALTVVEKTYYIDLLRPVVDFVLANSELMEADTGE